MVVQICFYSCAVSEFHLFKFEKSDNQAAVQILLVRTDDTDVTIVKPVYPMCARLEVLTMRSASQTAMHA